MNRRLVFRPALPGLSYSSIIAHVNFAKKKKMPDSNQQPMTFVIALPIELIFFHYSTCKFRVLKQKEDAGLEPAA